MEELGSHHLQPSGRHQHQRGTDRHPGLPTRCDRGLQHRLGGGGGHLMQRRDRQSEPRGLSHHHPGLFRNRTQKNSKVDPPTWAWRHMPVIPALGNLDPEDPKFSLSYIRGLRLAWLHESHLHKGKVFVLGRRVTDMLHH